MSDFFRNILFPQQMFPRLCAKETMLTGFCDVGRISSIGHAQTFVFIEKILGLPGKETLCPTRLRAQETLFAVA